MITSRGTQKLEDALGFESLPIEVHGLFVLFQSEGAFCTRHKIYELLGGIL
jgi:hypothetical protein